MTTKASKDRPRLGRGLSSLVSLTETYLEVPPPPARPAREPIRPDQARPDVHRTADDQPPATQGLRAVDIDVQLVAPNPHQPRRDFDQASLADMAASLKSNGMIQPILVRQTGGTYQLIAGERRLRAAKLAGMATVPALIREADSATQAQLALIENIQRQDLNPLDRASGYRTLIDQLGLTQVELAGRLGEDRSSITNFLRLLDLADPVKAMIRDGRISLGHAKLLAGVADPIEQERLANLVVAQGLAVRNLERLIRGADLPAQSRPPLTGSAAHISDMEKTISRQIGMRVQLRAGSKGRGRLTIYYSNLDQFDELLGRMGVKTE